MEETQQHFDAGKQEFLDQAKGFRRIVEAHAAKAQETAKAQEKISASFDEMRSSFEQAVAMFRYLSRYGEWEPESQHHRVKVLEN
ncbi:MAG: hypothetical protein ACR2PG_14205 [Hyphomicrobiaceae bacterium]